MEPTQATCACGCGGEVNPGRKYLKGHWAKAQQAKPRLEPLPGPDEDIDIGELLAEEEEPEPVQPPTDGPQEPPGDLPPDAPPGHLRAEPGPRARPQGARRVTATVRRDIRAKVGLMLMVPGRVWKARDPLCGGAFVEQEPEISDAFTEIVCQSADLVEWFTGTGGGFMLWLNLAAACQPVAVMVWAHHIAHSVEAGQAPDMARYAA